MDDGKATRRLFIQSAAVLPLAASTISLADAIPKNLVTDVHLQKLLKRRAELVSECERLDQVWRNVYEQLPSWCRAGPKYLNEKGKPEGPVVGWPAARINVIDVGNGRKLLRPSPYDLRDLFEADIASSSRDVAVSNYRVGIRQLRERLALRRVLYLEQRLPRPADWKQLELEIEIIAAALDSGKKPPGSV